MLDKKYNHLNVEQDKYDKWLKKDYFKCDEKSDKKPDTKSDKKSDKKK